MPFVHDFATSRRGSPDSARQLLGDRGANLAIMTAQLGLPVPPGFTITTEACRAYLGGGWPEGLDDEVRSHIHRMEDATARSFGGSGHPLLVSVRPGAALPMPGAMKTILDLGLNDATERGLAEASGDPAFARACRRRFEANYREVVGVASVPFDPWEQLRAGIEAVFRSWNGEPARAFRSREGIPDELGTGVNVQAMVFGDRGGDSAAGVAFTRNPTTGEATLYGDIMFGAQGSDIVDGSHLPDPISALDARLPAVAAELRRHADLLERRFRDLCQIEFVVERGTLWLLDCRIGSRTPQAALRIAIEMAEHPDFPLNRVGAVDRVSRHLTAQAMVPSRPVDDLPIAGHGLGASPGIASGEIVTTAEAAVRVAEAGRPVILVRPEPSPVDIPGIARASGILTSTGGVAGDAAVLARSWGIPAVVGASDVLVDESGLTFGEHRLGVGEIATIDGTAGRIYAGVVEVRGVRIPDTTKLADWAKELGMHTGDTNDAIGAAGEDSARIPEPDAVVRALFIKGFATSTLLAPAVLTTEEALSPVLDVLRTDGAISTKGPLYQLTDKGRSRATELLEADRATWSIEAATRALDDFLALDRSMKETVTAWQMRDIDGQQALNDHTDAAYDRKVLAGFARLHSDADGWLRPLCNELARLGDYHARLAAAASQVADGDHAYIASPRLDSYHSIWFELHEDLIHLAGRTREDEVAAGRA